MKKNIFIFFLIILLIFQLGIFFKMKFEKKAEKEEEAYIEKNLSAYSSEFYLKYKPTLFASSSREGFELKESLASLLYEEDKLSKVENSRLEKMRKIINNEIFCKLNWENRLISINNCLNLFSNITLKNLGNLKKIEMKNDGRIINYKYNNSSLWTIKISSDKFYELKISKELREKMNDWYSVNLPNEVYGKLTEDNYYKIVSLKNESYDEKNMEEIKFLKEIIPFIEFSL